MKFFNNWRGWVVLIIWLTIQFFNSQAMAVTPQIAAGSSHTCALNSLGGVQCWGSNINGQLGDGTTAQHLTPIAVSGLTNGVAAIAAGSFHSCALTLSGGVKCWGNNTYGQLGDNSTMNRSTPVDVTGLTSGVIAITAGSEHSCALTTGGAVQCWGHNLAGELGDNSLVQRNIPVTVSGLSSGVTAIAGGNYFSCALTSVGAVKCWGNNFDGELGDTTTTNSAMPVNVSGLSSGITAITTGAYHACALNTAGAVNCWGYNAYGQVGDGSSGNQRNAPVAVSGLSSGVAAMSDGWFHSCALTTSGAVQCWGNNSYGQLGDNTATSRTTPTAVSSLSSGVSSIVTGSNHSCAVMTTGSVACWGDNSSGQLGDNTSTNRKTPVTVVNADSSPLSLFFYQLTISPPSYGVIDSDVGSINCGAACIASYINGASVTLTAIPDAGFVFSGWTGDCAINATDSCALVMDADKTASANFVAIQHALTVNKNGTGIGSVSSASLEIDCGNTCSADFNENDIVTLTAYPDMFSIFTGWSGGGCSGTGTCVVTMDAAKAVNATFTLNTLTVNHTGQGRVYGIKINCGTTCTANYFNGMQIRLSAYPKNAAFEFSGWSGACSSAGTATSCVVTMNGTKTVTALFNPITGDRRTLTVSSTGSGRVSGFNINCGVTCSANYKTGSNVTLTARPSSGATLTSWGGACSGAATTCTVTMNAAKSVTATFSP